MSDYGTLGAVLLWVKEEPQLAWWKNVHSQVLPVLEAWAGDDSPKPTGFAAEFKSKYMECWHVLDGAVDLAMVLSTPHPQKGTAVQISNPTWRSFNIDGVAHLLQAYLKEFDIGEPVAFSWSEVCDYADPSGFGGGCVIVTRKEIVIQSTQGWLDEWLEASNRKAYLNAYVFARGEYEHPDEEPVDGEG